ncbi:hypothetical protein HAP94_06400 [Acidithiobacillus ferrivorans]|nr:hypothetical protein [Acidithiobacillus ferrivorans]
MRVARHVRVIRFQSGKTKGEIEMKSLPNPVTVYRTTLLWSWAPLAALMALGLWNLFSLVKFVEAFPVPAIFALLMASYIPLLATVVLREDSLSRLTKTEIENLARWSVDRPEVCRYVGQVLQTGRPLTRMFYTPVQGYVQRLEGIAQREAEEAALREVCHKCVSGRAGPLSEYQFSGWEKEKS